jgi:hypothetical protein
MGWTDEMIEAKDGGKIEGDGIGWALLGQRDGMKLRTAERRIGPWRQRITGTLLDNRRLWTPLLRVCSCCATSVELVVELVDGRCCRTTHGSACCSGAAIPDDRRVPSLGEHTPAPINGRRGSRSGDWEATAPNTSAGTQPSPHPQTA